MNIKMAINSQLSTIESKKLSKQAEQKQNHRYGDRLECYQLVGRRGRMGEKVQGLRSTNWQIKNRQGDVKDSIGNGVAKELICMSHELSGGIARRNGRKGAKGEKQGQL